MVQPQRSSIPGEGAVAKWNAELAFRSVVEATADKAGLDFMRHLVKNLAQSLGAEHAFVAEFAGSQDRGETIAFWSRGDWGAAAALGLDASTLRSRMKKLGLRRPER